MPEIPLHYFRNPPLLSGLVSRISAGFFALSGVALLFASDVLLPQLLSGYPANGEWLGQLLGAALLGLSSLNWTSRRAVIGGIYGRTIVLANLAFYVIAGLSLLRAAYAHRIPAPLWAFAIPIVALSVVYGWLLRRGPLPGDLAQQRSSSDTVP